MAIQINHEPNRAARQTKSGLISEEFIAEVNERADILQIIERSVKLKKSGATNWLGLCPFHNEKGPSFTVTPSKGMYHCFGCGASGGAITFLMEHDGVPFREAIKELAVNAGLSLPAALSDQEDDGPVVETAPLYQSMELASQFFRHVLRHDKASLDYIKSRGINAASVKKFNIGATADEWRGLREAFQDYDTNPHIVQSGLIREKESEGGKTNRYDTFRARIMFPVRDTRGRIIAFGGRILGDGEPKYMNSPESPIFNKSGSLYGLFEAREAIRLHKMAVVVEGYIDVVMLAQHGVEYTVACMGTSMTRWHVERLFTQTDTVVFAFDGDAAGSKAAWRSMETCIPMLEDQHDIRFLLMPEGKDPDDLAKEEGAAAFEERVRKAPSLSEFMIGELRARHNQLASTEDRARFAAEGSQLVSKMGYKTKLRSLLLQRISEESRVPGSVIKALQASSNSRSKNHSLWSVLSAAALAAPEQAIEQRDLLIEILDHDDEQEHAFAQVLTSITPDSPVAVGAAWLVARDTMNAAVDMIADYRDQQVRSELKAKLQQGEITEGEYLRMSL